MRRVTYQQDKITRLPYPKAAEKQSKEVMNLIQMIGLRPMQRAIPSGKRYVLTFIDDYIKFCVIYMLQHQLEVSSKLKEYV